MHLPPPHSTVSSYQRDAITTQALQATASRRDGHVRLRLLVRVRSSAPQPSVRVLRAGRCVSGAPAAPSCPSAFSATIRIPANATVTFAKTISVPEPPSRLDAVQVVLTRRDTRLPYVTRDVNARLLLRGQAWRAMAGTRFGMRIDDSYVHRMTFDLAATSPTRAQLTFRAVGTAASAPGVTSIFGRCHGAVCANQPFGAQAGYSSGNQIGVYRQIPRDGAELASTAIVDPGGAEALRATLPWPVS